ncbi:Arm DNA-binding domain-containing protein [Novosphingobium sp. Rr 2-17]|uniref:Arm DNA-binding domain-containing protein n=1 Tax=Novosphingobium sp. Rr 2-17 TaxID=555793 RepID=UPI0030797DFD
MSRAKSKDKAYKLSDRDGLYLRIEPSGLRVWRMNYCFVGKQRTIRLLRAASVSIIPAKNGRFPGESLELYRQAEIAVSEAKLSLFST